MNNSLANSMFLGQGQTLDNLKQSTAGQQGPNSLLNPLLPFLNSGQFGQNLQQLQAQFLLNNQVGSSLSNVLSEFETLQH